jgi:ferredoxin-NADP reductase
MHLTKRFGIVAASQLPLHYLLAVKSPYSPLQFILQASHESLNAAHRVLGKVILVLLSLHALFYLNFFVLNDLLAMKLQNLQVILGLFSITLLSVVGTSALSVFRRWNYRAFYMIHVIGSTSLPIIIYFHVSYVRHYAIQAMAVSLINITTRLWCTESVPAIVKVVDGTNIISLSAKHGRRLSISPGQHMYLRVRKGVHMYPYLEGNPFTVASASGSKSVLMVRVLKGDTKRLQTAILSAPVAAGTPVSLSVGLEGPYGHSQYLPDLSQFQHIMLFAGGIGATYTWPLWTHACRLQNMPGVSAPSLEFHWAVRLLVDASWIELLDDLATGDLASKARFHLYVTSPGDSLTSMRGRITCMGEVHTGRPDVPKLVERGLVSHKGKIAILVCGPRSLSRQLRKEVGRHVVSGRDVYWHEEAFGF